MGIDRCRIRCLRPGQHDPVEAGSFIHEPPNGHDYDMAKDEEVVVQIWGIGPVSTTRIPESEGPAQRAHADLSGATPLPNLPVSSWSCGRLCRTRSRALDFVELDDFWRPFHKFEERTTERPEVFLLRMELARRLVLVAFDE